MRKIGLKLWSLNTEYISEAKRLFSEGVYDYIELYVVPDSLGLIPLWQNLRIPFITHAPHFGHHCNLADKDKYDFNRQLMAQAQTFADKLDAAFIIVHPGVNGDIHETVRQICGIGDRRILIENKPAKGFGGVACVGSRPEEIEYAMSECEIGFCMDVGHAICASCTHKKKMMSYLRELEKLSPAMYHLSDGDVSSEYDRHDNFGKGNYEMEQIIGLLPDDAVVTIETEKDSDCELKSFTADVRFFRQHESYHIDR